MTSENDPTPAELVPPANPDRDQVAAILRDRLKRARLESPEANLRRQLLFLGYTGQAYVELQTLPPKVVDRQHPRDRFGAPRFAFAKDVETILQLSAEAEAGFQLQGLYLIPNSISEASTCRARTDAWHPQGQGAGTKDSDITARRVLYIDLDPHRADGARDVSSTDTEFRAAFRRGADVYLDFSEILGTDAALGFLLSGNGIQLHVALDHIDADAACDNVVKRLLFVCKELYAVEHVVEVDTSVSDAKRICPLAGTWKRKGAHAPDRGRPHRRTSFVCRDDVLRLDRAELDRLLRTLECRLSADQIARVEKATGGPNGCPASQPAPTASPSKDSGTDTLRRLNEVPIREVASRLGIDADHPVCAWCGSGGSGSDVAFIEHNLINCKHARCSEKPNRTPIDLVAKVAFHCDNIKGTKGVVRQVIGWFATEMNAVVLSARRTATKPSSRTAPHPPGQPTPAVEESPPGADEPRPANVPEPPEEESRSDALTAIVIGTDEQRVNDEAVAALAAHDPNVYSRSRELVRILREPRRDGGDDDVYVRPENSPAIASVPLATLREKLASSASWVVNKPKVGLASAHPPDWSVRAVHARGQWDGIRRIDGVIETPTLRRDGSVISEPGYDCRSGLVYLPSTDFGVIPESLSRDDGLAAAKEIEHVVCDMPFHAEMHKSAWMAGLLTMFARTALTGPSPMFVVDGNVRGAGKGLACDVIATIAFGRPFCKMAHILDDVELEKRITAIALAGDPAVLMDNVRGPLGGRTWEAVLTTLWWRGRRLGVSEDLTLPLRVVWFATGNNIEIVGDMSRRVCPVRLRTDEERPEDKDPSAFAHPDLLGWVADNRPRLVRAALTMLRSYIVAGKPAQDGVRWGSYESWARLVASCLVWLGYDDPCKAREAVEAGGTSDASKTAGLMQAWAATFGDTSRTAAEVLKLIEAEDRRTARPTVTGDLDQDVLEHEHQALRDAMMEFCPGRDGRLPSAGSLGKRLAHVRHRVVAKRFFDADDTTRTGVTLWKVATVPVAGDAGDKWDVSVTTGKNASSEDGEGDGLECDFLEAGVGTSPASPASPALLPVHDPDCEQPWRLAGSCPYCYLASVRREHRASELRSGEATEGMVGAEGSI